jgi:hypothetical protein
MNEFAHMISEGTGPERRAFLSSFFTLVGTRGLHVTGGLVWMGQRNPPGAPMSAAWVQGCSRVEDLALPKFLKSATLILAKAVIRCRLKI